MNQYTQKYEEICSMLNMFEDINLELGHIAEENRIYDTIAALDQLNSNVEDHCVEKH